MLLRTPHPLPPGPGLSSVLIMGKDPIHGPLKLRREYGPIIRMPVGPQFSPVYIVYEPEMVHQVLVKNRAKYRRDRYLRWMRPVFGDGILVTDGEVWKRARTMMVPAFHRRVLQAYADVMVRATHAALDRLDLSRGFSVYEWTSSLTLDIALETLFGASMGDKGPRVSAALSDLLVFANATLRRLTPPPKNVPSKANRALARGMKAMDSVIEEILEERKRSTEEHHDLLALLMETRDEDGNGLSDSELHDQIITLLLAGHETTALGIAYALMVLGWNPQITAKAQTHLDAVIGDRAIESGDLRSINYINRIIQEVLRTWPPAAVTGREAAEEDVIAGYPIPQGAQVIIPIWSIHHDPRWYPQPFKFDPDRWTPEKFKARPHYAFVPFGGGQRACIGEQFARMEMQVVLSTILQRFSPRTLIDTPPGVELLITMRPTSAIRAELHPRGAAGRV